MNETRAMGRKNDSKNYRKAFLVLCLVLGALLAHEVFGQHGWLALQREKKQYESLQREIQQLQQENEELQSQINALRSDPKAIERAAREQMHMARPGEIILALPSKDRAAKPGITK